MNFFQSFLMVLFLGIPSALFSNSYSNSLTVVNDECAGAIATISESGITVCETGCTTGAQPDTIGTSGCFDHSFAPTVWYQFTTPNDVGFIRLETNSTDFAGIQVSINTGNCGSLTPVACLTGINGALTFNQLAVNQNTTYFVAVSSLGGQEGFFDLCLTSIPTGGTTCNEFTSIYVQDTKLGSPISGPFLSGDTITMCADINYSAANNNCQWLHGIVPEFGAGWDNASFNANGSPTITVLPGGGLWNWYEDGDVFYNDVPGGPFFSGDNVGAGWFVTGVAPNPTPVWCSPNQIFDPNCSWGIPMGCGTIQTFQICFDLITNSFPSCETNPEDTDCSVSLRTFGDGETGGWVQTGCQLDVTWTANFSLNCCDHIELLPIPSDTLCPGQTMDVDLTNYLPVGADPQNYAFSWQVDSQGIEGTEDCTDGCGTSISQTLVNPTNSVATAVYSIYAQDLESCYAFPTSLAVTLEPGYIEIIEESPSICMDSCVLLSIQELFCNPPYIYEWSTGETGLSIEVCPSATTSFSVLVTDQDGVTLSDTALIIVNPNLGVETIDTGYYNCESGFLFPVDGDIYTIGSYEFDITIDSLNNACQKIILNVVQYVDSLSLNPDYSTACNADAFIHLNVSGGQVPYHFEWNTADVSGASSDSLSAGFYAVTVTDNVGCSITAEFDIINTSVDYELNVTNVECDSLTGEAIIAADSIANYSIGWSTGDTGTALNNLAIGGYSVTVTNTIDQCQEHEVFYIDYDPSCHAIISGYVYGADSLDCSNPSIDLEVANARIELSDGQITYTDFDGYYEFEVGIGSYTIELANYPNHYDPICGSTLNVEVVNINDVLNSNNFNLDFEIVPDIQLKVVKGVARPGFEQAIRICVMNIGTIPVSTTVTCKYPDIQTYLDADIMETGIDTVNSEVFWDLVDIPPGTILVISANFQTDPTTPIGTPLTYSFTTDDQLTQIDPTPENNTLTCTRVVTGAYDPNDKVVDPMGTGPIGLLTETASNLSYQIRFQNTGNDTAFTVLLRDTLDLDLSLGSLRPQVASHDFSVSIKDGSILEVLFENIMLPDSFVNERESHGFFIFDIALKDGLPPATELTNSAGIYFDFNAPIITNTVLNTTFFTSSVDEKNSGDFLLYPNPTSGGLQLILQGEPTRIQLISILDIQGRRIQEMELGSQQYESNIEIKLNEVLMSPGIYLLEVLTEDGQYSYQKFIYQ